MGIGLNWVAGVAAAAFAITACGVAAGTSGGTQQGHAVPVSARHVQMNPGYSDLRDLAKVKRDISWQAADPAGLRQPQADTSACADLRDLAKVKQNIVWEASGHGWGR